MSDVKSLYDEDFLAWSKEQAEALRSAGRGGSNRNLDWKNLAEEIGDLGKSERSAVGSYVMRIVQHLVKLDHSVAVEPRKGWRRTVRLARLQVERRVESSPSLKPELTEIVEQEICRGIEYAIADLEEYEEIDEVGAAALRRSTYTADQVLGDWFPPEPQG
ncbi:MAG: DUF29 domain-containing protein [Stellaceae bacterium]